MSVSEEKFNHSLSLKKNESLTVREKVYHMVGFGSNYWHQFSCAATRLDYSNQDENSFDLCDSNEKDSSYDKLTPPLINLFTISKIEIPPQKVKSKPSRFNFRKLLQRKKKEKSPSQTDMERHEMEKSAISKASTSDSYSYLNLPFGSVNPPVKQLVAGMTHLAIVHKDGILMTGTLHGHTYPYPMIKPACIPLNCTEIVCGDRHVLGLFEGKVVMSWGSGYFGQLGHGLEIVYCHNPTMIERLSPRYVGGDIVSIFAGGMQSGAIICDANEWKNRQDRTSISTRVFRWGGNRFEQLAIGSKANAVPCPTPMKDVFHPETGKRLSFVQIDVGKIHSLGLDQYGEVYSWGCTANGRCGQAESDISSSVARSGYSEPKRVEALRKVIIKQICAGDSHSLALSGGGRVFSWGNNASGQLGMGHTINLLSPRQIMDLDFGRKEGYRTATRNGNAIKADQIIPQDSSDASMNSKGNHQGETIVRQDSESSHSAPTISSIYAAGSCSAALSSSGELYTWGCDDANHLGHFIPSTSSLSNLDVGSRISSSLRLEYSCSFDSRLNILLPKRVDILRQVGLKVESVTVSPNFIAAVCSEIDMSESSDE